jgi:two-component system, cell cycle sensor histidine kinase and response regulator CckA
VLVVDDEEEILAATRDLLEVLGYEVACVTSGSAALQAIDAGLRPGLVLVDQRLPGEDGIQVAEAIRSRLHGPASIAILSGDVDTTIDTRAAQSGFQRLMKPLSQARVQQLLAMH